MAEKCSTGANTTDGDNEVPIAEIVSKIKPFNGLDKWLDGSKRYIFRQMIQTFSGKIDEKIKFEHASDQIVWNIIHIEKDKSFQFPKTSPTYDDKLDAMTWLKDLRSALVKEFMREARINYFNAFMTDKNYEDLRKGIKCVSFKELERQTQDASTEKVRRKCVYQHDLMYNVLLYC